MKPKTYRRVTWGLFCFLFLIFFLLYLLLRNGMGVGSNGGWGGELVRDLGTVTLSEVRSSGFIVDEFSFPESTQTDSAEFNQNVVASHAVVLNEGKKTIRVSVSIYGTKIEGKSNQGLCGAFYYYKGDADPVASDYAKYLRENKTELEISSFEENNMELYVNPSKYPKEILLEPGEQIYFNLFCWVDQAVIQDFTDEQRQAYSATVKLTSRAV